MGIPSRLGPGTCEGRSDEGCLLLAYAPKSQPGAESNDGIHFQAT